MGITKLPPLKNDRVIPTTELRQSLEKVTSHHKSLLIIPACGGTMQSVIETNGNAHVSKEEPPKS